MDIYKEFKGMLYNSIPFGAGIISTILWKQRQLPDYMGAIAFAVTTVGFSHLLWYILRIARKPPLALPVSPRRVEQEGLSSLKEQLQEQIAEIKAETESSEVNGLIEKREPAGIEQVDEPSKELASAVSPKQVDEPSKELASAVSPKQVDEPSKELASAVSPKQVDEPSEELASAECSQQVDQSNEIESEVKAPRRRYNKKLQEELGVDDAYMEEMEDMLMKEMKRLQEQLVAAAGSKTLAGELDAIYKASDLFKDLEMKKQIPEDINAI